MSDLAVTFIDLGIVGLLVGISIAWSRLRFVRDRSAFRCRLALIGPTRSSRLAPRWSKLKARAKWKGDVLVIQLGPLRTRTLQIPVHLPLCTQIQDEWRGTVRRLGAHPQSLLIHRDGCDALLLAVRAKDRTRLVGPFLAAAVPGLPSAPRPHRWRRL